MMLLVLVSENPCKNCMRSFDVNNIIIPEHVQYITYPQMIAKCII